MLLVRPSGTENKIRILAESQMQKRATRAATEVQTAILAAQKENFQAQKEIPLQNSTFLQKEV